VAAIFRKGEIDPASVAGGEPIALEHDAEVALGKQLARVADAVHEAASGSYPHLLCEHLYALARAFSSFYEQCPVLKADDPAQRRARLRLVWLTKRQLARGLSLLGIAAPDRM
jgi:arginyl-tRNA synthetase